MATYSELTDALPLNAKWSSSFGHPGEGGYTEYWRNDAGERWVITNGPYNAVAPFDWTVTHWESDNPR
jgi:hypothetical protein